ncbi:hemin uptake protein HemP [uncultured Paracoccus sp.]|uniref:hemin uptake protein HemP n=1 Tax=uncultured Paracoccus sp. TaxID=189685 RepID=UPI00261FEE90|nr:hemin uptake protein HemP [uncultured Paracoccus sp.]
MTINPPDFSTLPDIRLAKVPVHDAAALTQGGNQALIALGDQLYNLRITRAGKLILTK